MSHPYLDQPVTGVHDWPEDHVEDPPVKVFKIKTPKGMVVRSTNLRLLQEIRTALWPPTRDAAIAGSPAAA